MATRPSAETEQPDLRDDSRRGQASAVRSPLADDAAPHGATSAEAEDTTSALAWRVLSSPQTFLALSAALALVFVVAAALPQRPSESELVRALSFSTADVVTGLGLTDVLVAWPTLLLLLLLALNAAGIFIARAGRRRTPNTTSALIAAPIEDVRTRIGRVPGLGKLGLRVYPGATVGRRGLVREGALLALIGVIGLGIGLVIARRSALDARFEVVPGVAEVASASVRDGEVFVPRAIPYGLMCERPDPQDRQRAFDCRLAVTGASQALPVNLAPGYATRASGIELSPLRETLRRTSRREPIDLLLTRAGAVEALRLTQQETVVLRSSGEQMTGYLGPDGPMIVVESKDGRAQLWAPRSDAVPVVVSAATPGAAPTLDFTLEAETPTRILVSATTSPESTLVIVATLLFVLGLLLMALVPHLELVLTATPDGTRVSVASNNRPALPHSVLAKIVGGAS